MGKTDEQSSRPVMSREQIQQTLDLQFSLMAMETDQAAIEAGVLKVAALNASLRWWDDIDEAREQVETFRRQSVIASRQAARSGVDAFQQNCNLIVGEVFRRTGQNDPFFDHSDEAQEIVKTRSKYFAEVAKTLSVEDAEKQVDECLTAAIERRDWKEVVRLPRLPGKKVQLVNNFGEFVGFGEENRS